MKYEIRFNRPRKQGWPAPARPAAAIIAIALALASAGYGASLSVAAAGGSASGRRASQSEPATAHPPILQQAIAYAHCMRSHGVRNWPDPNSNGVFPKRTLAQLGVSSGQLQAAQTACRNLLPSGVGPPNQTQLQQAWSQMRHFAQCMRSHGVRSWPDPSRSPQHPERPVFNLQAAGIDANAPQISHTIHLCESLVHFRPSTNMLGQ